MTCTYIIQRELLDSQRFLVGTKISDQNIKLGPRVALQP